MNLENDFQTSLTIRWFNEMISTKSEFKEPILNEHTMNKIKLFCDSLQQDSHVFLMTVEILERYIAIKNEKNLEITDPFLLIITVIYLSGKYTGELSDFKTGNLISLYDKLTHSTINNNLIKLVEFDIFIALDNKFPLYTKIDDLKVFLTYYVTPMKLKFNLMYLCEEILNFFVMHHLKIFNKLKDCYLQNGEAYSAFVCIYASRIFIPMGILVCALRITDAKNVIDMNDIVNDLAEISNIHADHIFFLACEIHNLWLIKSKSLK